QVAHERGPAGDARDHRAGLDVPAGGLDAGHATVVAGDAPHLGVGMDLDARLERLLRVAPHHRVVADDAAGRVVERPEDRVGRFPRYVELRAQLGDLVGIDHARV